MTSQRYTSVWDAIEDTPAAAENMKWRSKLMLQLKNHIDKSGLSQAEAAEVFGVTQPRISNLMQSRINLFSIDALVEMTGRAGIKLDISFVPKG